MRPTEAELKACVHELVSVPCGVGVIRISEQHELLPEIEARAVASAAAIRRNQFAAGRIAARAALAALGVPAAAIPRLEDGRPQWPANLVGSISHTSEVAVAIVLPRTGAVSVGIDIESNSAVTEELWREILDDREIAMIRGRTEPLKWATAAFALKEAFYKFQHPITEEWLDFKDVSVEFRQNSEATVLVKKAGFPRLTEWTARFAFVGDWVVVVVVG